MRHASAFALPPQLVEHPLPRRAAAQLRLALDMLPDAAADRPDRQGATTAPTAAATTAPTAAAGASCPRLAWPDRPPRARLADGSPAPRRADFYEWILSRRRRAQLAARRALAAD